MNSAYQERHGAGFAGQRPRLAGADGVGQRSGGQTAHLLVGLGQQPHQRRQARLLHHGPPEVLQRRRHLLQHAQRRHLLVQKGSSAI